MNTCTKCGSTFQGESWQKICKPCFAKSKQPQKTVNNPSTRDDLIVRQTSAKIAGEIVSVIVAKEPQADTKKAFTEWAEHVYSWIVS